MAVDGLTAKSIKLPGGADPAAGTLKAGSIAAFARESTADVFVVVGGSTLGTAAALDTGTASGDVPVLGSTGLAVSIGGVPIGAELDYAGSSAPTGYLLCDGSAVSRTTYAALFTAISTTFGEGDGSTTFNVPDRRGRVTIGAGTGTDLTERELGDTGGAETHTLTADEMPAHTHSNPSNLNGVGGALNRLTSGTSAAGPNFATTSAGGGDPHNNMPPFSVATKIIRAL